MKPRSEGCRCLPEAQPQLQVMTAGAASDAAWEPSSQKAGREVTHWVSGLQSLQQSVLYIQEPPMEEVGLEEQEKKGKTKQPQEVGWLLFFLPPGGNARLIKETPEFRVFRLLGRA